MFETTDDFILFEYENFYGFWKAMEKSPAVYANRQILASPREREQIISLHAWVKNRVMLGISAEAHEYTPNKAAATKERQLLIKAKEVSNKTQDLDSPLKFKSFFRFQEYVDSLMHYLSRVTGAAACPLSYILREDEDPGEKWKDLTAYHTSNAYYVDCIQLCGTWYETDNSRVWSEIKNSCESAGAWEYIKRFSKKEDGRSAFLRLVQSGASSNSKAYRVLKANNIIADTKWTGPKQNFTFDHFVAIFVAAYNELELMGSPQYPINQVNMFLRNILDTRADHIKAIVWGDDKLQYDFTNCYTYMQKIVDNKMSRLKPGEKVRKIGRTNNMENSLDASC